MLLWLGLQARVLAGSMLLKNNLNVSCAPGEGQLPVRHFPVVHMPSLGSAGCPVCDGFAHCTVASVRLAASLITQRALTPGWGGAMSSPVTSPYMQRPDGDRQLELQVEVLGLCVSVCST